ncbi:MAG: adenylate/guanylate cyclase domain-containing protein [Candidatus Promineifilaceae bacterium]
MENRQRKISRDVEINNIEITITTLEAQRHTLGDLVVDTAQELLRERLSMLLQPDQTSDERKRVTVLFADVSGYTALSENLDPEEVVEIMNGLFDAVTQEIHKYNGTVDKYSGDAVMALFGAPTALENHEEMAVRAALGMQQAIRQFSQQLEKERGFSLRMRIGLNTGEVLAGLVGGLSAQSYTVMGDTVNLASRLEHACPVGRVMISAETARPLLNIFDFEPPQQITVKGKSAPVTTYLVVGEKAEHGRVRGIDGLFAPMVGREEEFTQLKTLFEQLLSKQQWLATAVIGDAGLGKSRLQREFVAWITHSYSTTRILSGRCYAHTRTSPYAFLAEMMRGLFHITPNTPTEQLLPQLKQVLNQISPGLPEHELGYQIGSVASVLGVFIPDDPLQNLDPEQRRDRTFLSLERILLAVSRQQPTLIMVDDLHWADSLSLTFLERLLQLTARELFDTPVMLLVLGRPPEEPTLGYGRLLQQFEIPPLYTIHLHTLDTTQSNHLINALLSPDIPEALRQLILDHAQGNPLYVEEVLRSLIEDGTLKRDDQTNQWLVTRNIIDVKIPPSVQGIIAARLDRLPRKDKQVTQYAAIIGRVFWQQLLKKIAGTPEVESSLLLLEVRQLAERLGQSQIAEDWEWVFHHTLIQEVAYASVPKAVRRTIHQQVAAVLEEELSEKTTFLLPLIANHYEAGEMPEKAINFLARSGEQAVAQFANEDAVSYFTRALNLLEARAEKAPLSPEQLEMKFRLLNGRVNVYHIIGQRDKQNEDLQKMWSTAQTLNLQQHKAITSLLFADYYEATNNYQQAIEHAQKAYTQAQDNTTKIKALTTQAFAHIRMGNFEDAQIYISQAHTLAKTHQLIPGIAISSLYQGMIHYFLGDFNLAKQVYEQALHHFRLLKDLQRQVACLNNLVAIYHGLGDIVQAKIYCEEALSIAQTIGKRSNEATILTNLGAILHALGDLQDAYNYHLQAFSLSQSINDRLGESLASTNVALVLNDLGEYEKGLAYAELAAAIDQEIGDKHGQGYSLTAKALLLEGLKQLDTALATHKKARKLRRDIGQDAPAIDNLAGLTRLYLQQNKVKQALDLANEITEWLDKNGTEGVEFPLRAYHVCIEVYTAVGDNKKATKLLTTAYNLLINKSQQISDEDLRHQFLNAIPVHRMLVEKYQKQCE